MKQPLLLLSGLLCDETIWADIPEGPRDAADVRVISFRGFSSIPAMAEHVLATAPERFAVAGHSMGGRVALEVVRSAQRGGFRPRPAQSRRTHGSGRRAAEPRPLAAAGVRARHVGARGRMAAADDGR